jgi:hypothetical protein
MYSVFLSQLPEINEVAIGKVVKLKKRAQLGVMNALLGQKAKQPLVGKAILDRVCLDAD